MLTASPRNLAIRQFSLLEMWRNHRTDRIAVGADPAISLVSRVSAIVGLLERPASLPTPAPVFNPLMR